ncbi:MAG: SpoIIIAH-like family protein [Bacillota bacterium]
MIYLFEKKIVWMMVLMVWVGMVTSIILYEGDSYLASHEATSENVVIDQNDNDPDIGVDVIGNNEILNHTRASEEGGENFFIDYRLERDKARSEQLDIYREMINNPNTDKATKEEAQKKIIELTARLEKEMKIESLIRARGYEDALAYIHEESVDVIVQSEGLKEDEVAQIGDIIVKTTGLSFDDVTIIEKKIEK